MKGNIAVRHAADDLQALILANCLELSGMKVISVVFAYEEFIVFARFENVEQLTEADKLFEKELNSK